MLVELVLIAGIAERQRPGHRIEGGLRDRNADHRVQSSASTAPENSAFSASNR